VSCRDRQARPAARNGVGRRIGSAALVADGLHARTDGFTSLAVLLGVAGVALGWQWADPVIGLLITVAILGVLGSALRQVGARLMDAVEPDLVDRAIDAIRSVEGIDSVRDLRIRWIGHTLRAEADVTVDPDITVGVAHDLAHHAEEHLLAFVPRLTAATIHVSPAVHIPSDPPALAGHQSRIGSARLTIRPFGQPKLTQRTRQRRLTM
jgi:cation diffusion facilitator family transporter